MSVKKVHKILTDIEQNKPINLLALQNILSGLNLHHRFTTTDIEAVKTNGQKYRVTYLHPDLKAELQRLVNSTATDRISAAQQNLSHTYNVLGSFLILRQHNRPPEIVLIDSQGNYQYEHPSTEAVLLIENRQLFISIEATLQFLYQYTDYPKNKPLDIIFAAGNEISNELHQTFLNHYQHIYCLFDVDLGGLTIARNLYRLLNKTMTFLVPDDIHQRLANVVRKCDHEYIDSILKMGQQQPQLQKIVNLITQHHKVLEQEEYLRVK